MARKAREVILAATIEYDYESRQHGLSLGPGGKSSDNFQVAELERDVKQVLTDRLPQDLANIFGIHAETRITATRYGSLTVFFGVVLGGLRLIASYKGFYDSIQLIRKHAELLLEGLIRQNYGARLDASVAIEHPHLDDPRDLYFPRAFRKLLDRGPFPHPEMAEFFMGFSQLGALRRGPRDGFFWFLLCLSCVLLVILGLLVYAAVAKTYFP